MAEADFGIKQGTLGPPLDAVLRGADDTPQNLTNASVTFSMEHENGKIKVATAACAVLDAAGGQVRYQWVTGDTDTPGRYRGEFIVSNLAPTPVRFPSGKSGRHPTGYIEIEVLEAVA